MRKVKSNIGFPKTVDKSSASNVIRLSELLTKGRKTLKPSYLKDKDLRDAYIHYYVPVNMYKILVPLRELAIHPSRIFEKEMVRVLDLGSGPGTAILGILDFFSSRGKRPYLKFTAVDPISENLLETERLFKLFIEKGNADASLLTIKSTIEKSNSLADSPFDIITLSNVLSEIAHHYNQKIRRRINLLKTIINRSLTHDGSCIIIEPALRDTSREMLEVRNGLVEEGLNIYSPCLMNEMCPALTNPADWCHEDIPWEPPEIIKEIDRITGLRKDSLKFSYLIIRKDSLSIRDIYDNKSFRGNNSFRVVSEPLISKGKLEFYICGTGGRRLIVRLDKDSSMTNKPFETLRRGDIVSFEHTADEGKRLKLTKDTTVTKIVSRFILTGTTHSIY